MDRNRLRPTAFMVAAAIAGSLIAAAVGLGADGDLSGKFKATVRAVEATFPVDTEPVKRDYKFSCKNGKCSKVGFRRESGDGVDNSVLKEKKPGVFVGTERAKNDDCPDSDSMSDLAIKHQVKIVKTDEGGKATKIKGKSRYLWSDCPGDPTPAQTTKFKARIKR